MTTPPSPTSALDHLPPDQRAVLEMVLRRGRDYDELARLLSIDRAAVRRRAVAALHTLGPATRISLRRRALITDYLLDQLPADQSEEVCGHLAQSATARAWATVVAFQVAPLSREPLPEIPAGVAKPGRPSGVATPRRSTEVTETGSIQRAPQRNRRGRALYPTLPLAFDLE